MVGGDLDYWNSFTLEDSDYNIRVKFTPRRWSMSERPLVGASPMSTMRVYRIFE